MKCPSRLRSYRNLPSFPRTCDFVPCVRVCGCTFVSMSAVNRPRETQPWSFGDDSKLFPPPGNAIIIDVAILKERLAETPGRQRENYLTARWISRPRSWRPNRRCVFVCSLFSFLSPLNGSLYRSFLLLYKFLPDFRALGRRMRQLGRVERKLGREISP